MIYEAQNNKPIKLGSHAKTSIRYHIIFSTKYRKNCLGPIKDKVLEAMKYVEEHSHYIKILVMNLEGDHLHMLVRIAPQISVGSAIGRLKQMSTHYLYRECREYLKQYYWGAKEKLWTHGYFVSTIGEVSESKVREYIESQG